MTAIGRNPVGVAAVRPAVKQRTESPCFLGKSRLPAYERLFRLAPRGVYCKPNSHGHSKLPKSAAREHVASLPVKPGLFALRYLNSESAKPPRIFVQVSPSSLRDLDVIYVPGNPKGVLEEPESFAIVVAERTGAIQLTVVPFAGSGSDARVQLEPLKLALGAQADGDSPTGEAARSVPASPARARMEPAEDSGLPMVTAPARAAAHCDREALRGMAGVRGGLETPDVPARTGDGLSMTCHVSRRGDVTAPAGEWIGGPDAPAVIEGVALHCGDLGEQRLEYQVLLPGSGGVWSAWVGDGGFAGTRGRGLGILGLRVRLAGGRGEIGDLRGEAVFLGCPLVSESGRELEFTSYAGADPMVGLRLRLETPRLAASGGPESGRRLEGVTTGQKGLRIFKSKRSLGEAG